MGPDVDEATQAVAPALSAMTHVLALTDATQVVAKAGEEPTQAVLRQAKPPPEPAAEDATQAVARAPAPDEPTAVQSRGDTWFEGRLRGFIQALREREDGTARAEPETHALCGAARDMLDRLATERGEAPEAGWDDAVLQPGQVLANTFVVRALIARGGMGEIYRARHRDLQTEIAVKILLPRYSLDPKIVALLLDEARLLQQVRSEAVVACHGLLRDSDGRMLLLMEYLRGGTLSSRIAAGPISVEQVTVMAKRLGAALEAIHAERIIHQDVSPDNVMLCNDSFFEAKLIDFGVARSLLDAESAHEALDLVGKYSWMSPEQLTPGAAVSPASDYYSLGLVLAAAARGRRLEMGTDAETARAARTAVPALDDVPEVLHEVIGGLLATDPTRRIVTSTALEAALVPGRRMWFGLKL